jgi:hypothetical protein
MCDFTEMNPYIAELRAAQSATPSPAPASPSRDALQALPLCRAGAGDLSTDGASE